MGFSVIKTWDDRKTANRRECIKGRTWFRRVQWLEDGTHVKLKLEVGTDYKEVIADCGMANTVWQRFKEGQSIADSVSILAIPVPPCLASRRVHMDYKN